MPVRIVGSGDDEPPPDKDESPRMYVQRLAVRKAKHALRETDSDIVLGADTSVVLDSDIFGKPVDASDAAGMLQRLRDRAHDVITGVAVMDAATGVCATAAKTSTVFMRDYSDEEIAAYIKSGEPFDKAGAYAAQDKTFMPATGIEGCYPNVVGLPICDVLTLLERIGAPTIFRRGWEIPPGCEDCDYWSEVSDGLKEAKRL